MSSRASPKVVVLMGGPSAEREVSLSSGCECAAALRETGLYEVIELDAGADLARRLEDLRPDVAFNALHGRWGEDGCVQGILEWLRIPYTHSGVLASALAMDKERTKDVFRSAGIPVTESVVRSKSEIAAGHVMKPPYVIKPRNEGSSVGIYLVLEGANGPPAIAEDMPDRLMVETYIPGRELTTSVMGDRALGVTEILTDGWYDYHAKYAPGGSRHVVPAEIPDEITALCEEYAIRAHEVLGCKGVSRTDFRWNPDLGADGLVVLEINTQPGMTPTSLVPEQAGVKGIGFPELCRWMVEDASCDR
ncbi:D-alanine--D-alanine ligase [Alphaproteobacteria bacterium GH1-50]|uniref:D-alanine--D-alanine ligase n=1 Tax=Kangsaoukella pontilimi TaxID=2691042 RepID=A0A7C9IS10_9RHOB|nr:D-alanine--D-alanine ligase [Kangsaoukella pontilimi]MXQ07505.1 D-alanine--D-alanine ligase [Kangsaoukella pontilimi]